MDAGVQLLATIAKPGNLIHDTSEVCALLACTSLVIAEPLQDDTQSTLRCQAGTLLIILLHRPSIEALLAPQTSLEVLEQIPNGHAALQWCADTNAELGSWGVRARAMLRQIKAETQGMESVVDEVEDMANMGTVIYSPPAAIRTPTETNHEEPADITEPDGELAPVTVASFGDSQDPLAIFRISKEFIAESSVAESNDLSREMAKTENPPALLSATPQIDCSEARDLEREVSALGSELGSLEAELQAELMALESECEDCEPEEEPKRDLDAVSSSYQGGVEVGVSCHMDAPDLETERELDVILSSEASAWLTSLLTSSTEADLRERVLSELQHVLGQGGPQEEFEAAGLIEVYRESSGEDVPHANQIREALRYLYQNTPMMKSSKAVLSTGAAHANIAAGRAPFEGIDFFEMD
jgi:hypothetical protein